jgi:hypothetical protein
MISRRELFKLTAAGIALATVLPPAEVLAEMANPKRFFPLDSTMLRAGHYDLYLEPRIDLAAPGIWAQWYEGDRFITAASLTVDTVIADEPHHALAPLAALTKDFVGPQATLVRAFYRYPVASGPAYQPFLAEQRLLARVEAMRGQGRDMPQFNPSYETNPPMFTNRPNGWRPPGLNGI